MSKREPQAAPAVLSLCTHLAAVALVVSVLALVLVAVLVVHEDTSF